MCYWVNTHGLFLWRIIKGITVTNASQKNLNESNASQIKYGLIKAVNFIIDT